MARFLFRAESGGRPLAGASVTVYAENDQIAVGQESAFQDADKQTIYTDVDMTVQASNPITTDANGEALFYTPAATQIATKAERSGYGSRWDRHVDVTGSDPV
jgi:hypothetical protein